MNLKTFVLVAAPLFVLTAAFAMDGPLEPRATAQSAPVGTVPKPWNERELSDWATPLAELGHRPRFYSATEFEKIPQAKLYRAYPVYHPDHEPPGYWEWLQRQPP